MTLYPTTGIRPRILGTTTIPRTPTPQTHILPSITPCWTHIRLGGRCQTRTTPIQGIMPKTTPIIRTQRSKTPMPQRGKTRCIRTQRKQSMRTRGGTPLTPRNRTLDIQRQPRCRHTHPRQRQRHRPHTSRTHLLRLETGFARRY